MAHNLDFGTDADFVAQLRGMAGTTPGVAVPGAATIVAAGRSRLARRRSIYSGVLGAVLLAGAGFATMPHVGVVPGPVPVAAVSQSLAPRDLPTEPVGVMPLLQPVEVTHDGDEVEVVEAGAGAQAQALTPLGVGLGIAGTAALGTAAGLAIRSRKLAPVAVKAAANN